MYAANESADDGENDDCQAADSSAQKEFGLFHVLLEEDVDAANQRADQHCVGRREGSFRCGGIFHDDRTIVDDDNLKEDVEADHHNTQNAVGQDFIVYCQDAASSQELHQSQECDSKGGKDGDNGHELGDGVPEVLDAEGVMYSLIDMGQADGGSLRSDGSHINRAYQKDQKEE